MLPALHSNYPVSQNNTFHYLGGFILTVSEAVLTRRSIRAFQNKAVPKELMAKILNTARRSPSGSNVQPWYVHVLTGQSLEDFRKKVKESLTKNPMGEGAEYEVYPKSMTEPYRSRRYKCGEDMYATLKIERENKFGRLMQFAQNFDFFGAPVGMLFTIDRSFGPAQWAHLGMFIQTIMLVAEEQGLATCAQESWLAMYKTGTEFLDIPDNQMIYCGMAIGYADTKAPVNTIITDRAPLSEIASFKGFES